jgi:putative ABC transport system permease protein
VLLSRLGGVFGVILGLAVTIGYAVSSGWPVVVPVSTVAAGLGGSVLIGTIAGWLPAARAARLPHNAALASD